MDKAPEAARQVSQMAWANHCPSPCVAVANICRDPIVPMCVRPPARGMGLRSSETVGRQG